MSRLYGIAAQRAEDGHITHISGTAFNKRGGMAPCGTSSDKNGIAITPYPEKVTCLRCLRWLS